MRISRIGRREFICGASVLAASTALGGCPGTAHSPVAPRGKRRLAAFCCDVTPPIGTPIYSSYKPLSTVEHPLLAKGIVIEDGRGRYVLCAVDWCELCNSTHRLFRQKIAKAAGIDPAHVAVQTVHQHTAPIADGDAMRLIEGVKNPPPHPSPSTFEEAAERVAGVVKGSLEKLAPFDRLGTGQARVERVASNRRVPVGEGKVGFRGSSCKDPHFREMPEGTIDPFLKTITFSRGDKPLARLHYYATHPQSFYGDPRASYDFPGIAREALEKKEGVFQIYFTGCAGDIAAGKYNDGSPPVRAELAQRLLAGMEAAIASTRFSRAPRLCWKTVPLLLTPRDDGQFNEAACAARMADEKGSPNDRTGAACEAAFRARSRQPIELSSLHVGDVYILHLPGEPMIEYQLYAQQLRPEAFVAVAGYSDGAPGYLCLERSFPEGGYEPSASNVVPQSEGVIRAAIRELLDLR
jgi:hypothetical protein